jgi:hypothetical protein
VGRHGLVFEVTRHSVVIGGDPLPISQGGTVDIAIGAWKIGIPWLGLSHGTPVNSGKDAWPWVKTLHGLLAGGGG